MTIEYDAPHRTETQRLGDDIAQAMTNLRRDWPHMIRPGETQSPGWTSRTGVTLDDHAKSDADQRRIDRVISLRRFAVDTLNGWSRVIIEDRGTEHHIPSGVDVPGMAEFIARHADWMSGHEAAQDCRDELRSLAHDCHLIAFPTRRESISIGRCPLEVPGEQDVLTVCGGDVRSRPARLEQGEPDGQAWCACSRCGEVAVAAWWEERMFDDDPELRRWITDEGVVTLMHRMYGEVIARSTVRGWVKKGVLVASTERTDDGRRLFDRDAVVYAIDLFKRRQATQA